MMLDRKELKTIAKARLKDAEILSSASRPDGALYLCGYAVEVGLKERICRTLKWDGFPVTRGEFTGYQSFKTHNLDVLLRLTGREIAIKSKYLKEWSLVSQWNPESRYNAIGEVSEEDVREMIKAAKTLIAKI